MGDMEPLIITSNDPMVGTGPADIQKNIDAGVAAAEAGAAILHHHLIFKPLVPGKMRELDRDASVEVIRGIRKRTDAIFQFGMTGATNESRFAIARAEPVDQFSITLSDNDNYMGKFPTVFRDREDMIANARFCLEHGIMPEWEVFHSGAAWNLHFMLKKGLATRPAFVNLMMYWEGSTWSPRTMAEIDHRASMLPEGSIWHLAVLTRGAPEPIIPSISPDEHTRLLTYAILRGGHVRTGLEDKHEMKPGVPAKDNAECIRQIKDIAERLGRPVATPEQARRILKLKPRG